MGRLKTIILVVLAVSVFAGSRTAAADGEDVSTVFDKGCDFYESGDFDAALEHFQSATSSGVRNAAVYYNLGNCYYKRGDLGMAVANYRRALMLSPRDEDTKVNLSLLRRAVGTGDTTATYSLGNLALIPLQLMSPRELRIGFYVAYFLTAICFLCVLFFKAKVRRMSIRGMVVLAVVALAFLAISDYGVSRFNSSSEGVVVTDRAELKSRPGDAFGELTKLPDGAEVRLRARSGLWLEVELPTGEIGWLREKDLAPI
jgi:tetratricopeptide (TPR) repeat protein